MAATDLASRPQQALVRRLVLSCAARQLATGVTVDLAQLEWLTTKDAGAIIARLKRRLAAYEARVFPQMARRRA